MCLSSKATLQQLGLGLGVAICFVAANANALIVTDVLFEQTNWLDPDGNVLEANSRWGSLTFSYSPDPTTTHYLNLSLANSANGSRVWAVQNMPLTYVDNGVFDTRCQTVNIDLEELGYGVGDDWSQTFYDITIDTDLSTAMPQDPLTSSSVADFDYNSWTATSAFGTEFSAGKPHKFTLYKSVKPRRSVSHDLPVVEEEHCKCTAGSFARSLDWLNRKHNLGLPGAMSIYNGLIAEGVSDEHLLSTPASNHADWIGHKQDYLAKNAPGKVITKIIDPANGVNATPGTPQQEGGDFYAWLKREWEHGEDIEITYRVGAYEDGSFAYRHTTAIVDVLFRDDMPIAIRTAHDLAQGKPGGEKDLAGYLLSNANSSGGYDYYFNSYDCLIEWAVSESVVPEPSSLLIFISCLSLLLTRKFRCNAQS